jgi:hypothetical protein
MVYCECQLMEASGWGEGDVGRVPMYVWNCTFGNAKTTFYEAFFDFSWVECFTLQKGLSKLLLTKNIVQREIV